ncbi:MAG TPA: signal peptide peptidase SppA [Planctomycetaceae bacterium]|nr:signal peptide peptidase SppA [Planctomycetaceae bacterium]
MRRFLVVCSLPAIVLGFSLTALRADDKHRDADSQSSGKSTFAEIELKGHYPEGAHLPGIFGEMTETLDAAIGRLTKAADDEKIDGVVLKINSPTIGSAKMNAFRKAIARVQAKGKKVHAWLDGASNMDYLLASACDEIVMPEPGTLMLVGIRAEVTFYKKLFDLVGVKADMLRVGEYKSAAEPYSRTEMSPEFRKEMEEILDDRYSQLVDTIAASRKLAREKVTAAIDAGPLTARQAKDLGLIDRLGYEDDLDAALEKKADGKTFKLVKKYGKKKTDTDFSGLPGMMKMMEMLMGIEQPKRKSSNPKLAIIYANGLIMTGKSQSDFLTGESVMGSDTMIKAIREANKDATVKAIVLRVDSPGGSALASDLMWHELELVKKPFVVSMGDVAGSGGYYIAMGADRIFADPGTITGSIGVVGGKFALNGLYGKIGITTDVISRGKNSGVNSSTTGFSDNERESMQRLLNDIYDQFTTKAAQGRKMEKDKLEKLARGRVYTGSAAVKIGLVDELGSLDDAIAYAKKQAGVGPDEKLEKLVLPKATSPLESLFGSLDPNADARLGTSSLRQLLRGISPELEQNLQILHVLQALSRDRVLAVMPFRLILK